jgi:uncharacterized protein (TIGR03083 family)
MVDSRDVDGIDEWTRAQRRVIDLVGPLSAGQAAVRVPACPDWTVRDLLSHMVGLGADVVAGDEPDDHNATWTANQVERRRDRDVAALVAEWQEVAGPLREWMRAQGIRPLNDVLIHEQDLRGALGVPGGRDTGGLVALRELFLGRFRDRLTAPDPVALVGETFRWTSDDRDASAAAVVVEAPDFELTRALLTRRSAAQIRAWTVRGDITPHLGAFTALGDLPTADLSES